MKQKKLSILLVFLLCTIIVPLVVLGILYSMQYGFKIPDADTKNYTSMVVDISNGILNYTGIVMYQDTQRLVDQKYVVDYRVGESNIELDDVYNVLSDVFTGLQRTGYTYTYDIDDNIYKVYQHWDDGSRITKYVLDEMGMPSNIKFKRVTFGIVFNIMFVFIPLGVGLYFLNGFLLGLLWRETKDYMKEREEYTKYIIYIVFGLFVVWFIVVSLT